MRTEVVVDALSKAYDAATSPPHEGDRFVILANMRGKLSAIETFLDAVEARYGPVAWNNPINRLADELSAAIEVAEWMFDEE